jgi:hypothetical protein
VTFRIDQLDFTDADLSVDPGPLLLGRRSGFHRSANGVLLGQSQGKHIASPRRSRADSLLKIIPAAIPVKDGAGDRDSISSVVVAS